MTTQWSDMLLWYNKNYFYFVVLANQYITNPVCVSINLVMQVFIPAWKRVLSFFWFCNPYIHTPKYRALKILYIYIYIPMPDSSIAGLTGSLPWEWELFPPFSVVNLHMLDQYKMFSFEWKDTRILRCNMYRYWLEHIIN